MVRSMAPAAGLRAAGQAARERAPLACLLREVLAARLAGAVQLTPDAPEALRRRGGRGGGLGRGRARPPAGAAGRTVLVVRQRAVLALVVGQHQPERRAEAH